METEETTFTMQDILNEEESDYEIADAVLGDSNETECSYSRGYIRQALYSCLTCATNGNGSSGVCLGCSLKCHDGHELTELYTKRHFRCDCGNAKFPKKFKCKLEPEKAEENIENKYNQNFEGVYCICSRPYPDPDVQEQEPMLQCCICEDWYHEKHLQDKSKGDILPENIKPPEEYDEMICYICMKNLSFLTAYYKQQQPENIQLEDKLELNGHPSKSYDNEISTCLLKRGTNNVASEIDAENKTDTIIETSYWDKEWRSKLCKCIQCKELYSQKGISFLLDPEDSLTAYELRSKKRKRSHESILDAGVSAFSQSLSHTQQVEMAMGYRDMAQHMKDFLEKYAKSGAVVGENDIKEFFAQLNSKRRAL